MNENNKLLRARREESAGTDDVYTAGCHGADAEMVEMVVMLRVASGHIVIIYLH